MFHSDWLLTMLSEFTASADRTAEFVRQYRRAQAGKKHFCDADAPALRN